MRRTEADWIRDTLLAIGPERASPLLNLGSESGAYRSQNQPHIERDLFAPLRAAGFEIAHADLKHEPGVDIVGDVGDPAFMQDLCGRGFRGVLASNLLEHVADATQVARWIEQIPGPGGTLIVTVPRSYPYHPGPIDTLFRPAPDELARFFPNATMIDSTVITDGNYAIDAWRGGPRKLARVPLRLAYRIARAVRRPSQAFLELEWVRWFVLRYQVTCAVLTVA